MKGKTSGRIYLIHEGARLTPMEERLYDSEDLLQRLLADYPDLLAGEQIDAGEPRRWLLVSREMGIPDVEDGNGRWSLDHLFLDQDAIPTLVEVKRSTDTRLRREVVGQMLDYASNAVVHWPVETIRAAFETRCEREGSDPEEALAELLANGQEPSDFWTQVKTNLQGKRMRMVFVADVIPPELRRIVEFLNEMMDPAEVLAVEIRQYVGEGVQTLVPRVIGQTEAARRKKRGGEESTSTRESVTEQQFLEAVERECDAPGADVIRKIVNWARSKGLDMSCWRGARGFSCIPAFHGQDGNLYPISLRSWGRINLQMRWMIGHPPFDQPQKRQELHERIRNIPGFVMMNAGMEGNPRFDASEVGRSGQTNRLIEVLDWIAEECEAI